MNTQAPRIFIMSGEPSGDLIGSYLATALRKVYPHCELHGVGGLHLRQAQVDLILDANTLAMVGFFEIVGKLPLLYRSMSLIEHWLRHQRPDLLILIDYPGFNLRLAAKAKALGIKVMYYVSPQIWAWHSSRIKKIKASVDLMAVLFPFEEKIYTHAGVPVRFVGHPIIERAKPTLSKTEAYFTFSLDPHSPIIAIMPGSRQREVTSLLPIMLAAAKKIKQQKPNAQFVLPLAPSLNRELLEKFDLHGVQVVEENTYNVLPLCDAAIVASGTATLEVAILEVPQVIVYRLHPLTYQLAKRLAKTPYFGLCNIVAQQQIARELVQQQVTADAIYTEIRSLLDDVAYRTAVKQKMSRLRAQLITENASEKAAKAAVSLIHESVLPAG